MKRKLKTFEAFNQDLQFITLPVRGDIKSLSFSTDTINKHLQLWKENDIKIKNSFDKEGVTYVEFYTKDDMKKAASLSQDLV